MRKAKITSVLLAVLFLFACIPFAAGSPAAPAPALAQQAPIVPAAAIDAFTSAILSDALINDLVATLYPTACDMMTRVTAEIHRIDRMDLNSDFGIEKVRGTTYAYHNHETTLEGTASTAYLFDAFHQIGLDIFPISLGDALKDSYPAVSAQLIDAGAQWSAFADENGKIALSFDWGIDAAAQEGKLAAAKAALTAVLSPLGDLLPTLLGSQSLSFSYEQTGELTSLLQAKVSPADLVTLYFDGVGVNTLTWFSIGDWTVEDLTATFSCGAFNLYTQRLIPLYRALGIGSVVPYQFGAVDFSNGAAAADSLLDPLDALITALRNSPALGVALYDSISAVLNDTAALYAVPTGTVTVTMALDGANATYSVVEGSPNSGFVTNIASYLDNMIASVIGDTFPITVTASIDAMIAQEQIDGFAAKLAALQQILTPVTPEETTTEPSSDPAGDDGSEDPQLSFLQRLLEIFRNLFERLYEWLKQLFNL